MWLIPLGIGFVAVVGFFRLYPPFASKSANRVWKSKNFKNKLFVNQIPTPMDMSGHDMIFLTRDMLRKNGHRKPPVKIKPEKVDVLAMLADPEPQVTWLGHSTALIRIKGKTLLTDPVLSKRASPFPFAGPRRLVSEVGITVDDLPWIDAVLISHNHYDHLDYATIKKLRTKTTKFFVPLGVAAHLLEWGVNEDQIVELDWWDEAKLDNITFACTPARHFSGRTLTDRFKTLWCSWVIKTSDTKLFFSGDTGYGPHFKEIGKKYGPFDLTLMECGQYNELWGNIHMAPEQTFIANQDLGGKKLLPIHWGAFVLALHDWTDSVIRVKQAAKDSNVHIVTPKLGEIVSVKSATYPKSAWWEKYQ